MTRTGMVSLRIAATLVHALPGVHVRLRHGERTVLRVARPGDAVGPSIGPCAFRATVSNAHRELEAGRTVVFGDLPVGTCPAVDVAVADGDVLPGGLYRVAMAGAIVHGFATTLPPRRCRDLLDAAAADVHVHHDVLTEVTLVHTSDSEDRGRVLDDVLGAFLADEVAHVLELTTSR